MFVVSTPVDPNPLTESISSFAVKLLTALRFEIDTPRVGDATPRAYTPKSIVVEFTSEAAAKDALLCASTDVETAVEVGPPLATASLLLEAVQVPLLNPTALVSMNSVCIPAGASAASADPLPPPLTDPLPVTEYASLSAPMAKLT